MKADKLETQQNQIKYLHKKYKVMDKPNIRALYEFCDYDCPRTEKILIVSQEIPNPSSVIRLLQKRPWKADQLLSSLENRYDKQYGHLHERSKKNQQKQNLKPDFFKYVPIEACLRIITFLDPYSLISWSRCCVKMNKITHHNAITQYFRRVCQVLFPMSPINVPNPSRLLQVRNYVLNHPHQFSPNTRNAVINKLQYFVWQKRPEEYQLGKQYYLNFGSYEKIFKECPRIHFNGIYSCKHRYLKQEERNPIQSNVNAYLVQYFRYFRFFYDGSVLSQVSSQKVKDEKLLENLSTHNLENEKIEESKDILIGEYRQHKENVYVKIVKGNSIFNYHLQIRKSKNKISNELIVLNYTLQLIDEKQIIQTLEKYEPPHQALTFNYQHYSRVERQNPPLIRSCSL